jgi:hypothetical protein
MTSRTLTAVCCCFLIVSLGTAVAGTINVPDQSREVAATKQMVLMQMAIAELRDTVTRQAQRIEDHETRLRALESASKNPASSQAPAAMVPRK